MDFFQNSQTNWKYILITILFFLVVIGGILQFSQVPEWEQENIFWIKHSSPEESKKEKELEEEPKEGEEPEKELIAGFMVPVWEIDKDLIEKKIEQGKEFLLNMENQETHGFYKKYQAPDDSFEERVHTVYSASIIYTFLKIYDFDKDARIPEGLSRWGEFLLSMQDNEGKSKGAFHYSYYLDTEEKEERFVVGTAALSIFTLLDLYQRTEEIKYLEAAERAGDWLGSMQRADGVMKPYLKYRDGKWYSGTKESLLYNGQVLSALSWLYKETEKEEYYQVAEKITTHFIGRVEEGGCFLGDEYRSPNPISSAWVIMSLLNFYKVNPEKEIKEIIFNCSQELVKRQMTETKDPLYNGRWNMAFSTSGNGWLAEVMMEVFHFCQQEDGTDCQQYKEAVIRVIRWLIQHTYSEENSFFLENPERAKGGLFWDYNDKYVRTDSVCHGLNAYIGIINDLEEGIIFSLSGQRD